MMVALAVAALVGGVACGLSGWEPAVLTLLTGHSDYILYVLMFLVGISVGLNKGLVRRIRAYNIRIFLIPLGIILGSMAGGAVCAPLLGMPLRESMVVAGGLGWYSLSGVMLTELGGATLGSIAFLSNLMREIVSFFCIPWVSKKLNFFCCIAPAGATSEDTTLPMMIRYTDEETVVLSVINGVLCSAAVPFLLRIFWQLPW